MGHTLTTIVFDLDGTLYVDRDLARAIHRSACRYIAGLLSVTVDDADRLIRDTKERLSAATGWGTPLSGVCRELGGDLPALHRHFAEEIDPVPLIAPDNRVNELLNSLAGCYGLYVYTNNNRALTDRIVRALKLPDVFRGIFTIEDTWRPKPDRESLERHLAAMGARPEECLFVGDRYDIDLRLPESLGSRIVLSRDVEELLTLQDLLK
jgi:putative hydrolase of the HAD superfamily